MTKKKIGGRADSGFSNTGRTLDSDNHFTRSGKPEVESLAAKTGELVNLLVEKHWMGIYLCRATGENAVNVDTQMGTQVHLHNTGLGKAVLAHQPESHVKAILDRHGMPQMTERMITDRDTLFKRLETIRDRGIAFDDEERLPGLQCVAVPILNGDSCAKGALIVFVTSIYR